MILGAQMLHLALVDDDIFLSVDHDTPHLPHHFGQQGAVVGMLARQGAFEHAERFADADLADRREDRLLVLEIGIKERFGYAEPLRNVVKSATAVTALVEQMARNLDDAIGLERREFVLDRRFRRFAGHALILC